MAGPLRVQEPFRAAFYIPFYVALAQRTWEADGVNIELVPGTTARGGGEQVLAAVKSGDVDVGWGGPIRVLMDHDQHAGSALRCLGAAVLADPFFIVGRTPRPGFQLADLRDIPLGTVSEVPTPWWILAHDLRQAGIDPAGVTLLSARGMAENAAALAAGQIEAAQLPEPFVSRLVRDGRGHVWDAAASRGPTAYSTFYATADRIAERRREFGALLRALDAALTWLHAAALDAIMPVVQPYYPDLDAGILADVILRYRAAGIWPRSGDITEPAFLRLRQAMHEAGAIRSLPSYASCVVRAV